MRVFPGLHWIGIVACMYCWSSRVGGPTSSEPIAFTETWACNCVTRRRSDGSKPSCGKIGKWPLDRAMSGPWTSFTTNSRPARNCGCSRWSIPSPAMCRCLIHVTAIEVKMSCKPCNGYAGKLATRRRSVSIRGLSSCLAILTFGPTPKASPWTSHDRASRPTMRSLKRSMAASAPNV